MRTSRPHARRLAIAALACSAAGALAQPVNVVNPSFEELEQPGEQFTFVGWIDFFADINDLDVIPFDGVFAAKMFGLFFYQFPFLKSDMPQQLRDLQPTFDLNGDGTDDCCDTVPANNTVLIQDVGDLPDGATVRLTYHYYQLGTDAPNPAGNMVRGVLNFRDQPFPAPPLGTAIADVDLFSTPDDTWITVSGEGVVPAGTNFVEIVLLQFQFATEYTPIDANADGVQDVNGQGFPAFDIANWGGGASHWDLIQVDIVDIGGCAADLDGDGDADADDFFDFLDAFASGNTGVCDIDGDGDCDADDFFQYLDLFAQGC